MRHSLALSHPSLKMSAHLRNCLLLHTLFLFVNLCSSDYVFKTDYFEVPLDHFSFTQQNVTFKIKYLYNNTYWKKDGPIFFYTGNEGFIEVFAQNTGFMWDIAEEFGALLLFAEHRYYGASMPFGNDSLTSLDKSGYLSSSQALADFADFLIWYKQKEDAERSPVIAFGGSYGGMLTAWMRMKYPHIVQGGIAASAPILQFQGMAPCNIYSKIVTADFTKASKSCSETIRKSWGIFSDLGTNDAGREWISKTFRLCQPLNNTEDVKQLKGWLTDVYGYLAMIDYPYENSFLEPVPGNPVNVVCSRISSPTESDKVILKSIFKAATVYFNYTGEAECLDASDEASGTLGAGAWDFQACTEMVMPLCTDGVTDMFEPSDWNLTQYSEDCIKKFGVKPQPYLAENLYGGRARDIIAASNIVFSNGLLDPWSGGGVLKNLSDTLIAVIIPEGAHHLDLRNSHPKDPPSVKIARDIEKHQITKWIAEYQYQFEKNSTMHPKEMYETQ